MAKVKAKPVERFKKTYTQGGITGMEIWIDTKTGVNYVFGFNGYAGGMTVLLDTEGKPVISDINTLDESK